MLNSLDPDLSVFSDDDFLIIPIEYRFPSRWSQDDLWWPGDTFCRGLPEIERSDRFGIPIIFKKMNQPLMIRKSNKLPGKVLVQSYDLEYGSSELSIQTERQLSGKRILIIDDLIATGGSLNASQALIKKASGIVCGALCIIELTELKGREKLMCPIVSLQTYRF